MKIGTSFAQSKTVIHIHILIDHEKFILTYEQIIDNFLHQMNSI
jgi:hypothetical protein